MDARWILTAASRHRTAAPDELAGSATPAEEAEDLLAPSPAEDIEEPEIDEVAPGLEDLGLFA